MASRRLEERLFGAGPKRVLALDGGGVRGIIALAFLERIETTLRARYAAPALRLCDYYDLIGGTSTGSIVATGLALGYDVAQLIDMYRALSRETFRATRLLWLGGLLAHKFPPKPLMDAIRRHVQDETLGSDKLNAGLAIVAKRLDTNSVWVLHNNPRGKFFGADPGQPDYTPNRDLPLASLIRASTAAPTYFEPEFIEVAAGVRGAFIDGGVSPHNNPALLMLMLAAIKAYGFGWPLGADRLMITSVGTGTYRPRYDPKSLLSGTGAGVALAALQSLLTDTEDLVQILMQWLSTNTTPWPLDSELGDLSGETFAGADHFHYQRYTIVLELAWLRDRLGLALPADSVARFAAIDAPEIVEELLTIARHAAEDQIRAEHFPPHFDPPIARV